MTVPTRITAPARPADARRKEIDTLRRKTGRTSADRDRLLMLVLDELDHLRERRDTNGN